MASREVCSGRCEGVSYGEHTIAADERLLCIMQHFWFAIPDGVAHMECSMMVLPSGVWVRACGYEYSVNRFQTIPELRKTQVRKQLG